MTRILTWNCRRATQRSPVWEYLHDLSPDVALLQEVSSIPSSLEEQFDVRRKRAVGKTGSPQRFDTVILVRGSIGPELSLQSSYNWVNRELQYFAGNLVGYSVLLEQGVQMNIVGIYNPAWAIPVERLIGENLTPVKLTLNREMWLADLLWSALSTMKLNRKARWVVGGDFNLSETFDHRKEGPRGNKEYLDRMRALGLTECLRAMQGRLTPTFKNITGGAVLHQMDHLFVTEALASHLVACATGDRERVFVPSLSDHLPVVADFSLRD